MENKISVTAAAKLAGISRTAMIVWVKKHELGEMHGTRYKIDKEKLEAIIAARKLLKLREPI